MIKGITRGPFLIWSSFRRLDLVWACPDRTKSNRLKDDQIRNGSLVMPLISLIIIRILYIFHFMETKIRTYFHLDKDSHKHFKSNNYGHQWECNDDRNYYFMKKSCQLRSVQQKLILRPYFWSQSPIRLLLIDHWIWCGLAQITY